MLALLRSVLVLLLILQANASLLLPVFAEGEDDPLWNRPSFEKKIINVGQRLLAANGITERIEFLRVTQDIRNASASRFGGPNTVVIYKDMLDVIDSDDELAAVLAHEIAHIVKRHTGRQMPKRWAAKAALWTAYTVGGTAASLATGGLAAPAVILGAASIRKMHQSGIALTDPISRPYEKEADLVGLDYMVKAGYNPLAMETLMAKGAADAGPVTTFFSSHPMGTERLAYIHEAIKEKYPQFLTEELATNPLPGSLYQLQVLAKPTAQPARKTPQDARSDAKSKANVETTTQTQAVSAQANGVASEPMAVSEAEKAVKTEPESESIAKVSASPAKSGPKGSDPIKANQKNSDGQKTAEIAVSPESTGNTIIQPEKQAAPQPARPVALNAPDKSGAGSVAMQAVVQPDRKPVVSIAPPKIAYQSKPAATVGKAPTKARTAMTTATKAEPTKQLAPEERADSVALALLTLQPNQLRILRMISQRGYLSRRELKEQMEYVEPDTLTMNVYELWQKHLIRILGAEPDEILVLSDWAAAALKPASTASEP